MQWKTYASMFSPIGALLLIAMLPEIRHQVTNSFFAGVLLGVPAWSVIALIEKRRIGPNKYPSSFYHPTCDNEQSLVGRWELRL